MSDEAWFYFSFADSALPAGSQFLGGCYIKAPDDEISLAEAEARVRSRTPDGTATEEQILLGAAIARSHLLGINPGGEVQTVGPIPLEAIEENVPVENRERLLTRQEINP